MNSPVRILLVDDHAVVRAGYKLLLSQTEGLEVIAEAATGEEGCEKYARHQPDLVVMDLNLPGFGGLEAIRRIILRDRAGEDSGVQHSRRGSLCQPGPGGRCPGLSLQEQPSRGTGGSRPDLQSWNGVYRSEPEYSGPCHTTKNSTFRESHRRIDAREFDIFCLMAQGHSVRDTATALSISVKTVGNYVTIIKEKLGVSTNTELVKLAYEHRLLTPGQLTEDQTDS